MAKKKPKKAKKMSKKAKKMSPTKTLRQAIKFAS